MGYRRGHSRPISINLVDDLVYRTSSERWRTISHLITRIERAIETSSRLDAHLRLDPTALRNKNQRELDRRLVKIELLIDIELDRLTAEKLLDDLAQKRLLDRKRA